MARPFLNTCAALLLGKAACSLSSAAMPTPFAPESKQLLLFREATLIDGKGGAPQGHMDILVRGERIEKVFRHKELDPQIAGTAKVVHVRGQYLMPGMIDAHVHLATPPNRRQAEAVLRRDIYRGVTAVRDMADDLRPVGDLSRFARLARA